MNNEPNKNTAKEKRFDDRPFSHRSRNGCEFSIDRCDLNGTLHIRAPKHLKQEDIILATAEMMTWHAQNVYEKLLREHSDYIKKIKIIRI